MGFLLDAMLQGKGSADPTKSQVRNLRTRLQAVGINVPEPPKPLYARALDTLLLPSRLQGRLLGQWSGEGGEDVREAVKRIAEAAGVSSEPLFEASIPWFGGGLTVAPTIPGMIGTMADVFNPLDPLNWVSFGVGDEALKAAAKTARRGAKPIIGKVAIPGIGQIAKFQPGAMLGPLREPVSRGIAEAGQAFSKTGVGKALARRFGTGMAKTELPSVFKVADPTKMPALDAAEQVLREVFGEGHHLAKAVETIKGTSKLAQEAPGIIEQMVKEADEALDAALSLKRQVSMGHTQSARIGQAAYEEMYNLFKELGENERALIREYIAKKSDDLPEKLVGIAEAALKKQNALMRARIEAGILKAPHEGAYIPRVKIRNYPVKFLQKARKVMGKNVTIEHLDNLSDDAFMALLGKIDPSLHARKVLPSIADPADINKMLVEMGFMPVFEEDIAKAMAVHHARATRALYYKKFFDNVIDQYGLNVVDAAKILADPAEAHKWGLFEVAHVKGKVKLLPASPRTLAETLDAPKLEQVTKEALTERALKGTTETAKFEHMAKAGKIPEVKTKLIPNEFAQFINSAADVLADPAAHKDGLSRIYNSWLQTWKIGTTVMLPGYWLRNKTGDFWLLWLAGVRNPRRVLEAADLLRNPKAFRIAIAPGKIIDGETLLAMTDVAGVTNSGLWAQEFLVGQRALMPGPLKKYAAKASDVGRQVVDNHSRLMLLIDRLQKGEGFDQAVAAVKKYLFDYYDLTPFERQTMRSIIPFYSWMRKNIPHEIAQFFKQPGKFTTAEKWRRALSADVDESDTPAWLKAAMSIPVKGPQGVMHLLPRLPYEDLSEFDLQRIVGAVNPLLRMPFEIAANVQTGTGIPIKQRGETWPEALLPYIAYQAIPRFYTAIPEAVSAATGVNIIPGITPEQAARRMATAMTPAGTYPGESAARQAQYEELERLLDLAARLKKRGVELPTLRELGL